MKELRVEPWGKYSCRLWYGQTLVNSPYAVKKDDYIVLGGHIGLTYGRGANDVKVVIYNDGTIEYIWITGSADWDTLEKKIMPPNWIYGDMLLEGFINKLYKVR